MRYFEHQAVPETAEEAQLFVWRMAWFSLQHDVRSLPSAHSWAITKAKAHCLELTCPDQHKEEFFEWKAHAGIEDC